MRTSIARACSAALALAGAMPVAAQSPTQSPAPPTTAPVSPPTSTTTPATPPAPAQQTRAAIDTWGFDPAVLVADGRELLLRAPDPAVDGLFQVLLGSARRPEQAQALCGLFDPRADRSLAGLNAVAARFDPATRERYVTAVANLFVAATQHPPQPFDPAAAQQALTQAGVRATMLNDGFKAGLDGDDPDARCRSLAMLLDALEPRPLDERAAVTRLLLIEGLGFLSGSDAVADRW